MVKFVRGLAANYNATTHADGIYFATDTQDIILNGVHYGAGDLTSDLTEINNKIGTVAAGNNLASLIAANASAISTNTGAIATLNGNAQTAGSVDAKVAAAIAGVVNNAPKAFDTLKEIADWIGSGDVQNTTAATMLGDISTLKSQVGTAASGQDAATGLFAEIDDINDKIGTVPANKTVAEMISDAQTAATYDDTALAARVTANESAISTLNGSNTTAGSVAKAVKDAVDPVSTKANANESAIATLNGNASTAGSVDYKINAALSWIEA